MGPPAVLISWAPGYSSLSLLEPGGLFPNNTMKTNPIPDHVAKELETRFTYHPPNESQRERYEYIRRLFHSLAMEIVALAPDSRERSDALTQLEHSMYQVNAAIARRETKEPPA